MAVTDTGIFRFCDLPVSVLMVISVLLFSYITVIRGMKYSAGETENP